MVLCFLIFWNSSEMAETSESPRHRNRKRSQSPSKNDGYVVFVPPTLFKKISSNEKSTVYQCLLGCPKAKSQTTVSHSSLNNARRHINVSLHCFFFMNIVVVDSIFWGFSRHFTNPDWTTSMLNLQLGKNHLLVPVGKTLIVLTNT